MNDQMGLGATDLPGKQCPITGIHDAHDVPPFGMAEFRCPGVASRLIHADAHTRRTDPATSREAAKAISPKRLTESRKAVLRVLAQVGPMADEAWMQEYRDGAGLYDSLIDQSPSGLRSRRADLVEMGLVEAVGETTIRRRRCLTWGLTDAGKLEWAAL